MDSFIWILGPVVVAFFGFLFWLIMGKMGSNQSDRGESEPPRDRTTDYPDE